MNRLAQHFYCQASGHNRQNLCFVVFHAGRREIRIQNWELWGLQENRELLCCYGDLGFPFLSPDSEPRSVIPRFIPLLCGRGWALSTEQSRQQSSLLWS